MPFPIIVCWMGRRYVSDDADFGPASSLQASRGEENIMIQRFAGTESVWLARAGGCQNMTFAGARLFFSSSAMNCI